MRIIFLEGLPGIGKTTLINEIKRMKLKNVFTVDEILENVDNNSQAFFMQNDLKKINKYKEGIIVIDRGAISTLSYNECLNMIVPNKDLNSVKSWFINNFEPIYKKRNIETIYLKKRHHKYLLRYKNDLDPYGSVKNQRRLEQITLNNIKKYATNYKIIYIEDYRVEEIIDEIIN